ncbi:MAG: carbohydrate kinase [Marinibacterium sp.]|nr:carbohydrate kinase [Marinibacterium sp.]
MIVCCGEALIDMLPDPTAPGRTLYEAHCGGAVFNTAVALGRLGTPAALVSGVSEDGFGQMLAARLKASGVDTTLLVHSARPTTLAMVHLKDGNATYVFYDEGSAGRMVQIEDLPPLPDTAQACFFGGISLCMAPVADALVAYARRSADSRTIMVDPNIRLGFADDETAYRVRMNALLDLADLVKVSNDDLAWIYPDMTNTERREALLDHGIAVAFVTRGADGAEAWLADGTTVTVPAPQTDVVDTIGAGDTFNAGILAHLTACGQVAKAQARHLDHDTLRDAMTLAVHAATVTVSRAGADSPTRAELPIIT